MGNSHLHAFRHPDDDRQSFGTDYDAALGEGSGTNEADVRLDQVLHDVGDRLRYDYDFGDGWSHVIVLESSRPKVDTDPLARCLAGRRAGPPEDIGGIWAYNDLVPTLAGESGAEPLDIDLQEWLGDFDPAAFGVQETDRRLRRI